MTAMAQTLRPLYRAIQGRRNQGLRGLYLIVFVLLTFYVIRSPGLVSLEGSARFIQNWLPIALIAMAQTIVMLTGGIDLALGAMVSLTSVIAAVVMTGPTGILGGILAALAVGTGVGAVSGAVVALLRLPAIIVTLAGSFILSGCALLILSRPGGAVPPWFSDLLAGPQPAAALLLVVLVIGWKIYLATPIGLGLYAAGGNAVGAFRSGVPVTWARIGAYAVSGFLAAMAGLFMAIKTGSGDPLIGVPFTLQSIVAAVLGGVGFLGGKGTMRGALAGSLLLSLIIGVMLLLRLPQVAQYVAQGLIIVLAAALPQISRLWRRA